MKPAPTILSLFLFLLVATPATAQEAPPSVPTIERAEFAFQEGLNAFEAGDFRQAARQFRLVYDVYGLNQKTTAANLIAGKALYRDGLHEEAAALLSDFLRRYPSSSYVDDARQVLARAQQAIQGGAPDPVALGILLPLGESAPLTQMMFNGIRLAVEEHNAQPGAVPVRMVFRDSGGDAEPAARAAQALVGGAGTEVVIGPLFSREAAGVAAVAERAGAVLVAPLANDDGITAEKFFVFQANPTITGRGRQMARFAVQELGLTSFGVVAQQHRDNLSERMAEGFQDEAQRLGARVAFYTVLPTSDAWGRLPEEIGALQFEGVEAVYMPLPGGNAQQHARAALTGLDLMDLRVTVLGNSEWHDLGFSAEAAPFNTTYTADFYLDDADPDVQQFLTRYQALTGAPLAESDRRLPVVGYDVARFVLRHLNPSTDLSLKDALRSAPLYEGVGTKIDFVPGDGVNRAAYVLRYRDGGIERLK